MRKKLKHTLISFVSIALVIALFVCAFTFFPEQTKKAIDTFIDTANLFGYGTVTETEPETAAPQGTGQVFVDMPEGFDYSAIPEWDGSTAYVFINGNIPFFSEEDKYRTDAFETYSDLDGLGRCGTAYANVCLDLVPEEERGEINSVTPSGWNQKKYAGLVDQDFLYNRCHLIAFMLAGENANPLNLVTGTRFMNVDGMLPWETSVQQYVYSNYGSHVLYRVTPVFTGDELVCRGVLMEAFSVEDGGGLQFCVYAYNVQPGIAINYQNGESWQI